MFLHDTEASGDGQQLLLLLLLYGQVGEEDNLAAVTFDFPERSVPLSVPQVLVFLHVKQRRPIGI